MNKNKAIVKFCVICLLTVIGILACFVNFRIPFTTDRYVGFMGAIESKMGIDLKGGVLAVFDTEQNTTSSSSGSYSAQIDATVARLEQTLTSKGYVEATVVRQGNKIRVEVPGMSDTTDLFAAIGEPAEIEFRREGEDKAFITAAHIKSVEYYQDSSNYKHGVKLTFTNDGGNLFRKEVENATIDVTKIYIYSNGELISSPTISSTEAGKDNTVVITGNYTKAEAEKFKIQIESGLFEVKLTISETSIIPPTLGSGALTAGIIACIVGLLFVFILMWMLYGDLGLLSNLSMLIFIVLFMFALAVVGSVQLTLPGIAGIILSIGMAADANIIIFERIKEEYKKGKRMAVAVETGFNKSNVTIIDANVTTIIAAAVLYLLGSGTIKGFAITLFLGVTISMFCSLIITRSLAKLYLYINNNNAARLKLKKDKDAPQEQQAVAKPKGRSLHGFN